MNYRDELSIIGETFLCQILEDDTHQPTEKLILAIKSLQDRIFSDNGIWKINGKLKRRGKLDMGKFRAKFFGEK